MQQKCKKCGEKFEIFERDQKFYKKIAPPFSVPIPTLCPSCRMYRRFRFRNERHLYRGKCGLCGKDVVTCYKPAGNTGKDASISAVRGFPFYCNDCWWSDRWDSFKYGVDFDFSKPFFEQWDKFERTVPHPCVNSHFNENSEFNHCVSFLKNCYLLSGANYDEDCYYGTFVNHSRDCCDNFMLNKCELCYECLECENCYNLDFSKNCKTSSDSAFLYNCVNCQHCFGCVNLRNKKYCLFNKELEKKEYEKEIKKYKISSYEQIETLRKRFTEHLLKFPQKFMIGEHNENATGDGVYHCKNSFYCFDVTELEDCSYCVWLHNAKDCYDIYAWGMTSEMCYECMETGEKSYGNCFCISCYGSHDVFYTSLGKYSKDLFGCVGIKNGKYCVFNKQYEKDEYFALREKIVAHMKNPAPLSGGRASEWGEFFPVEMSPFGHEESMAGDYFSIT